MKVKDTRRSSESKRKRLRLVVVSDTHELHREIDELPPADMFLHSGDFTMLSHSLRAIVDFNQWLGELPYPYKIVVPGNRETFLQTNPGNHKLLTNAIVLINESVTVAGLRIWGSPVTLSGPAFCVRSAEERRRLYSSIPEGTDIVITHGPPFEVLDCTPRPRLPHGDPVLLDAVLRVRPRLHVFGHIHAGYGIFEGEHTTFVNAALLGRYGQLDKRPVTLQWGPG